MTRKRYCIIEARSLEDIIATCDRHISNACKMGADYVDCGDGTPTDDFYLAMIKDAWADLREDVAAMLAKENKKTT